VREGGRVREGAPVVSAAKKRFPLEDEACEVSFSHIKGFYSGILVEIGTYTCTFVYVRSGFRSITKHDFDFYV
jgi:hypothetical protein